MSAVREQGCHCLCAVNHPADDGICVGFAEGQLAFNSQMTGRVDVAMCSPCMAATLAHAAHKSEENTE